MINISAKVPKDVTWEQLLDSINNGASHPEETSWMIFRYLQGNYKTVGSVMARTLLAAYMKLHVKRESLINSCMLGMAAKISEEYTDFQLPKFLLAWGYPQCLRAQDDARQTGKDGRQYLSLRERVERARQAYVLHHPDECSEGCDAIASMYAVKVFEKEANGRKHRYAKLVSADGRELIADSHQFACKPWEIVGRMHDVLTRVSAQGRERAVEIVASRKRVDEVFAAETGYVDHIDAAHGHIHVYDAQSRHFVAERNALPAGLNVKEGGYVQFCPIIVNGDRFKSAAIISTYGPKLGRELFGYYKARMEYVDATDCYIRYTLLSPPNPTPEGEITPTGFASTANMPANMRSGLAVGGHVHLILFLKRGKDGMKHNYVAEVY